jgi:diaminopropionate ammonia-lyase
MEDRFVAETMVALAGGIDGDPPLVIGESGSAGAAALMALKDKSEFRNEIGLDATSRVLLIASEGATDPDIYRKVVGKTPEAVGEPV